MNTKGPPARVIAFSWNLIFSTSAFCGSTTVSYSMSSRERERAIKQDRVRHRGINWYFAVVMLILLIILGWDKKLTKV